MAKFIKSFFNSTERRRNSRYEEGEDDKPNVAPHLDGRRKLSISRSGRMRQNKKRQSLSLELYNQEAQAAEKLKYTDAQTTQRPIVTDNKTTGKHQRSQSADLITADEQIDNAFEIIDKTLATDVSQL